MVHVPLPYLRQHLRCHLVVLPRSRTFCRDTFFASQNLPRDRHRPPLHSPGGDCGAAVAADDVDGDAPDADGVSGGAVAELHLQGRNERSHPQRGHLTSCNYLSAKEERIN